MPSAYRKINFAFFESMWRHIGDNPRYVQLDEVSGNAGSKNAIRQPLDWSSSSCGLFTGLLSLVALIINLIVYFALVNQVSITARISNKSYECHGVCKI